MSECEQYYGIVYHITFPDGMIYISKACCPKSLLDGCTNCEKCNHLLKQQSKKYLQIALSNPDSTNLFLCKINQLYATFRKQYPDGNTSMFENLFNGYFHIFVGAKIVGAKTNVMNLLIEIEQNNLNMCGGELIKT